MGSNSSSGGGGGNNNTYKTSREIGITTQYSKTREQDIKKEKEKAFQEQGAYNTRRSLENTPSLITKILGPAISKPLQKNAIRTRNFFTDYVLGEGGKKNSLYAGMNKSQFEQLSVEKQNEMYSEYSKNRMSGTRDAYGREIRGGDGGGAIGTSGQVVQAPTVNSPTTAEVSQSAAADAAEDNILLRKRRAKAVGRSVTIATGPTGSPTNGSLTLGRPSLLGRA
jgi:hypothetical protein